MSEIWGIPSPYKSGAQNHLFRRHNWTRNLTPYVFRTKHDIHNRASALATKRGLLHRLKTTGTLVYKKGIKIGPAFYPPYVNSALYFIPRLHRRRPANWTQLNFAKRWTVNRANNLPKKSLGSPSQKNWGPKICMHLFGFSTTSRLNGE